MSVSANISGAVSQGHDYPGARTADRKTTSGAQGLTPEQEQRVARLKQRDAEVKAHEQAHMAAAGAYVRGGATYQYEQGPDGQYYAVGGEVSIDSSPVSGDPRATIAKMEVVKRAALAPARPSSQDLAVASAAAQAESGAEVELMQEQRNGAQGLEKEQQTAIASGSSGSRNDRLSLPLLSKSTASSYSKNSNFPSNSGVVNAAVRAIIDAVA